MGGLYTLDRWEIGGEWRAVGLTAAFALDLGGRGWSRRVYRWACSQIDALMRDAGHPERQVAEIESFSTVGDFRPRIVAKRKIRALSFF